MTQQPNSLPALLLDLATSRAGRPMLRFWKEDAWHRLDWSRFAALVASAADGLRAQGLQQGDRVLVVSENRPEFLLAETAILSLGAVVVPTYTTNLVADHAHILRDSGARFAIVSTPELASRVGEAADSAGGLRLLVVMDAPAAARAAPLLPDVPACVCISWAELTAHPGDARALRQAVSALRPDDLACLIYTSGTGGRPKGVMLPHRCMLANQRAVAEAVAPLKLDGTCYLSFLPLSHAYEHTIGNYILPSVGMEVVYSRGADRLAAELRDIRPAILTAVPRLFEVLRGRITAELARQPRWKQRLFAAALSLGLRRLDGPPLGPAERLLDIALDRLVRRKVQARFGGRLVALVSGGARLDPDLAGFFLALGVPVLQGYGQTEAGPVVSVNLPWDNDRRSVGRPLAGIETRIDETGELLLRGPLVMAGYWNDPGQSAASLEPDPDGLGPWLRTEDLVRMVDGRIHIHDRRRDIIKLLNGEMVSPAKLESMLMGEPEIAQAVVAGDARSHVVALLVPAEGAAPDAAVQRVNARLQRFEHLRRWAAIPACTVENGLLTPTMKVKRRLVLERHADIVAALF